jgi:2-polyprenyl-3-methyl-5-hydroxy-6-metoxy-1,4-benzoquinol methylase
MFYRVDFRCDDHEPLQATLNRLYDYRDDLETKVLHRCRLNLFVRLLADLERRGLPRHHERALDIGCNAGVYSRILSDSGFESVEGLDIESWMIERANAEFSSHAPGRKISFRTENAEELDTSRRYDLILCTEVIEHTTRPERVIQNIRTVLAPGGVAIVSLPNACSLPFMKAALKYRLVKKARDPVFEDHLRYPFWRSLRIFAGSDLRFVTAQGTNLFWDATTLRWLARTPAFEPLNRAQFALARRGPLACVSQFFFMAFMRPESAAS